MNERNYWFGQKWLGIGLGPASWQGWACLVAYIIVLGVSVTVAHDLTPNDHFARGGLLSLALVLVETAVLVGIVWAKRDRSRTVRWRWFGR
ncbi:MAG TPA: hypothetical protein VG407_01780 [Caulobacteraceae bacterium]|jgi:hypothetical protein|nr:hypothetical protein [Caulobacteraceae bacterium]